MRYVVVFLMFAVMFFTVSCRKKQENPAVMLKQAIAAAQKADWETAGELAEKARALYPEQSDIILFSALAMEKNGRPEEALARLQNLPASYQDDYKVQYTLGRLLFRKGKYEQCLAPLKNALAARPDDANALLLLAKAQGKLNIKDTFRNYAKLLKMPGYKNDPVICNEIAVFLAVRGKAEGALLVLRDKCKTLPLATWNGAVILDYHLGRKQEAIAWYNRFLREAAARPELENHRFRVTRRLQEIQ
ncbi:MAG: tetratricopeptide repeat protein [Lentisphaeria bacterium]|nr:tetratricopeptide repeat protein [Lentisphaeria bacterium]